MKQLTLAIYLLAAALIFDSVLEYYGRERWTHAGKGTYLNTATGKVVWMGKVNAEIDLNTFEIVPHELHRPHSKATRKAPAASSTP